MTFNSRQISRKYIINKIKSFYETNYAISDIGIIEIALDDVVELFNGKKKGFQRCDAQYHDLTHTLQVVPPFIEIIDGWNKSGNMPKVSNTYFDTGIIAVLLHDTGYIKREGDLSGTGAKYTFEHIQRSIDFVNHYLSHMGLDNQKIAQFKNIISCTGVSINLLDIHFHSEEERIIGYALGTADLLGQMATDDYPEKLRILYNEFEESYHYMGIEKARAKGIKIFENADELLMSTKSFYDAVVMDRFRKMDSVYKYIEFNYANMKNPYMEAIEENIRKIENNL
ncbi:MAG: hypothetical protein NTX36_07995 [Proteobacteria bacterium]|nr:hypothetical protein [Pseudomonadota bacterium]